MFLINVLQGRGRNSKQLVQLHSEMYERDVEVGWLIFRPMICIQPDDGSRLFRGINYTINFDTFVFSLVFLKLQTLRLIMLLRLV